jgi:tetratricopeptide (TPR) repeat protein
MTANAAPQETRFNVLERLLASDPSNVSLLTDCAEAALDERNAERVVDLLDRRSKIVEPGTREINLLGLAALQAHRFEDAATIFCSLQAVGEHSPELHFNLAWARANLRDFSGALEVLSDADALSLSQAAMLRIQLLHQLGEITGAGETARTYIATHPTHRGLLAAVSVLALDIEDEELAAECAARAGDHPDALTTLGTLALSNEHATDALEFFERALATNNGSPRAWVGLGLARLMTGAPEAASTALDRGAAIFGDHLGSWIAAGWSYFVNGDLANARARFETALALDPTFAESHGSLAVLDVLEGRADEAARASDVAVRLDRHCYSAALAKSLLAAGVGDVQTAQRIFDMASSTPIDGSGRTIAQALARMGLGLK